MNPRVMLAYLILVISLLLSCCVQNGERSSKSGKKSHTAVVNVTILQEQGGRVSWLHGQDLIAFDKAGVDGYADVYVMHLDGSGEYCLTCDNGGLMLHNGNPSWHPLGEYIVFQAQDPDLGGLPPGIIGKYVASPGVGINNNLWVMTADGLNFWQVTHVTDGHGVLHPQFSHDGTSLLWSEIVKPEMDRIGHWVIKLADFTIENGEPRITNVRAMQPENLQLYEMHGFSPDGQKILFSGVKQGGYYYDMEIYIMDLTTENIIQLTDNDEWDEHAHFTPDGKSIIWVSSEGVPQPKGESLEDIMATPPKFEYWIMNIDGSNKCQLSGFNDPTASEYWDVPGGAGLGDFDFGPDGNTIVAKMRRGRGQELEP
jgi:Tol biopolymer transport system component